MRPEDLSSLIGDIYDASLDSSLWQDVLGKIKRFVGGHAAALAWKDAVAKRGDSFYDDGGVAPEFRQLYFEKYIKLDPCTTGQFSPKSGSHSQPAISFHTTSFSKRAFIRNGHDHRVWLTLLCQCWIARQRA
jgi:hypothetical protein